MRLKRSVQVAIITSLLAMVAALALPAVADDPEPVAFTDPASGPTAVEHCNDGLWELFEDPSFAHQGDCVSWVLTGDSSSDDDGSALAAEGDITFTINGRYVHNYWMSVSCAGEVSGTGEVWKSPTVRESGEVLSGSYADGVMTLHSDYTDVYYWYEFEAAIDIATGAISSITPTTSSKGQWNMAASDWVVNSWTASECGKGKPDDGPPSAADVCKDGGWETFVDPTFRNQGDCVSYFATDGQNPPIVDGDDSANRDNGGDGGDGGGDGDGDGDQSDGEGGEGDAGHDASHEDNGIEGNGHEEGHDDNGQDDHSGDEDDEVGEGAEGDVGTDEDGSDGETGEGHDATHEDNGTDGNGHEEGHDDNGQDVVSDDGDPDTETEPDPETEPETEPDDLT